MGLVISDGSHGDDIVIISRRIIGCIPILVSVTSRSNDGDPGITGVGNSIFHGGGSIATQAQVDDIGTVVGGIVDTGRHAGIRTPPGAIQHLDWHDSGIKGYAGYARIVVGALGYGAADVCTVMFVVVGVGIVVNEVPAVDVVCIAVAVIVYIVTGYFTGVSPESGIGQVICLYIDVICFVGYTAIYHSHCYTGVAPVARRRGIQVPGGFEVNLVKVPLVRIYRVVRLPQCVIEAVGLGVLHD